MCVETPQANYEALLYVNANILVSYSIIGLRSVNYLSAGAARIKNSVNVGWI
jgi:hypothetical protein